jgi:hypothetical protein
MIEEAPRKPSWLVRILISIALIGVGAGAGEVFDIAKLGYDVIDWRNSLVGTWTDPDFQVRYVIYEDGTYEFYDESSSDPAESGAFKVLSVQQGVVAQVRFTFSTFEIDETAEASTSMRDFEFYKVDDNTIFVWMSSNQDGFPNRLDRVSAQ